MSPPLRTLVNPAGIALTFDDGPSRWTPLVLDELSGRDARATFFVTPGGDPEIVKRIAAAGHEVAYHCGEHVRHTLRDREEVRREASEDLEGLAALGVEPRAWRPPWGDLAPWSASVAAELGLELWLWSHDSYDWDGRGSGAMLSELSDALEPGGVILMHDGLGPGALRSDVLPTVELIAPLIDLCRDRGLEPATLTHGSKARVRVA